MDTVVVAEAIDASPSAPEQIPAIAPEPMAESAGCCSQTKQAACCEPSAKPSCCGAAAPGSCGCQ